jgi:VanZ family protein
MSEAPPSPLPRRKAVWHWLPVLLWVGVMLYFSSAPNPYARIGEGTTTTDILGHLFGFVVLAALLLRWLRLRMGGQGTRAAAYTLALCLLYALFDEVHQIPIPGRSFAWLDLLTDAAGAAAAVGAALAWQALRRRAGA